MLDQLRNEDATSISAAKDLIMNPLLAPELAFISANFSLIADTVIRLEKRNLPLTESLHLLRTVKNSIDSMEDPRAEPVKEKLKALFTGNSGLNTIERFGQAISSGTQEPNDTSIDNPHKVMLFKNAPITSVDVERTFSEYKRILTDQRQSFQFVNLKKVLITAFNKI